ncbi:hypothetical protein EQO05_00510 [Methanosarcina sp. MSH10X1]|uniref:hypothetical protein n=1 Tax=Methanosarcina sp. MSH10X1 TaxID=2507075 RepID=UPI000FFBFF46|nr:hypothetical protein [Methanosarcina sp. MSH10X1]RXA21765.1 hypothetical protein EQO05_00510 [Methanosarcina sp. MSH10X1]
MPETSDLFIFWAVVTARFLIPLTIPGYPLPGIILSLVLDMVDQTLFQEFTNLPLEGYQDYDKALDIYYLAITYLSTLRNWSNFFAFEAGRFLFYFRLIGVAIFEITHLRLLLLIFPNVFEYFFIFYELVRLKWDPKVLTKEKLITTVAFIWVFIKLPQEYWLHIARMDTTDWVRANPSNVTILIGWAALLIFLGWWLLRDLPPMRPGLIVAASYRHFPFYSLRAKKIRDNYTSLRFFDDFLHYELFEKIVLISLLSIIFAQILPEVRASSLQVAIGITVLIIINTELSQWFARRGTRWKSIIREFIVMAAVNFGIVLAYDFLIARFAGSISLPDTLFFILLLTLNVILYDRYRRWQIWNQAETVVFAGLGVKK